MDRPSAAGSLTRRAARGAETEVAVLLGKDAADEADDAVAIGEDPSHVGAAVARDVPLAVFVRVTPEWLGVTSGTARESGRGLTLSCGSGPAPSR